MPKEATRPITAFDAMRGLVDPGPKRRPKGKTKRVGLSGQQENAKRASLLLTTPSIYWVNQQFKSTIDTSPDGDRIEYRYVDANAFPPKADLTPMCRCQKCLDSWVDEPGIAPLMPPDIRQGSAVCVEHIPDRMNEAFGPSPSGHAIATLQYRNLRLENCKLPTEKTKGLLAEIRRFERKQQRREGRGVNYRV